MDISKFESFGSDAVDGLLEFPDLPERIVVIRIVGVREMRTYPLKLDLWVLPEDRQKFRDILRIDPLTMHAGVYLQVDLHFLARLAEHSERVGIVHHRSDEGKIHRDEILRKRVSYEENAAFIDPVDLKSFIVAVDHDIVKLPCGQYGCDFADPVTVRVGLEDREDGTMRVQRVVQIQIREQGFAEYAYRIESAESFAEIFFKKIEHWEEKDIRNGNICVPARNAKIFPKNPSYFPLSVNTTTSDRLSVRKGGPQVPTPLDTERV